MKRLPASTRCDEREMKRGNGCDLLILRPRKMLAEEPVSWTLSQCSLWMTEQKFRKFPNPGAGFVKHLKPCRYEHCKSRRRAASNLRGMSIMQVPTGRRRPSLGRTRYPAPPVKPCSKQVPRWQCLKVITTAGCGPRNPGLARHSLISAGCTLSRADKVVQRQTS
jgi:hypothetical protein